MGWKRACHKCWLLVDYLPLARLLICTLASVHNGFPSWILSSFLRFRKYNLNFLSLVPFRDCTHISRALPFSNKWGGPTCLSDAPKGTQLFYPSFLCFQGSNSKFIQQGKSPFYIRVMSVSSLWNRSRWEEREKVENTEGNGFDLGVWPKL